MNYLEKWADMHIKQVLTELKQGNIELTLKNIPLIIEATSFRRRSTREPNACPYYKDNKPCHLEVHDLNCFLCACPEYQNQKLEGGCEINCELGTWYKNPNLPLKRIWDCSNCAVSHFPSYVKDYLEENMDKLKSISEGL